MVLNGKLVNNSTKLSKREHPELIIRKSVSKEETRIKAASEENIRGFYQQLVEAINKYGLQPQPNLQC